MKRELGTLLQISGALLALPFASHAQHGHLNAGATGQNQDDPLIFANGADFDESSAYVKTLNPATAGTYAGYFEGNITFTALPTTALNGGPDPQAPAPGSFIVVEFQSVEGPAGGEFSFWESGATTPTHSIASSQSATHRWHLSDSDASPGSDPFGHVHGRRFTATLPGIYRVTFQLFDTSTNGAEGGPIHTPSEPFTLTFQAGLNLERIEPDVDHTHIRFAATAGRSWQVQASTQLGEGADWQPVGGVIVGDDLLHEVDDETPVTDSRFYRIIEVLPEE
jgi:hypothetical protein